MWKAYHLSIKGIGKGYLFFGGIKKGKGLDLGAEPLHMDFVENPFPPNGLSLALQNLLRSVELH